MLEAFPKEQLNHVFVSGNLLAPQPPLRQEVCFVNLRLFLSASGIFFEKGFNVGSKSQENIKEYKIVICYLDT